MATRIRFSRVWICALLVVVSLAVVPLQEATMFTSAAVPEPKPTTSTSTRTGSSLSVSVSISISHTTVNVTLRDNSTTITASVTETVPTTITKNVLEAILEAVDFWIMLALVAIIAMLLGASLILRGRYLRASAEADIQRRLVLESRNQIAPPETTSGASGALSRLLELGVIQPKEYMEKKMTAERLERKANAKRLLDEGLISNDQYEALIRKEDNKS